MIQIITIRKYKYNINGYKINVIKYYIKKT